MSLSILYALVTLVASHDHLTRRIVVVAPSETLAVAMAGSGPTIVLLPGMLGGTFAWRRVTAGLLDRGHRVVVIELLGTGSSGRPQNADYSLERQAQRVSAVLDSLGIDDATVAAHGIAGSVALRLALADPRRVQRVVLLEGGASERAGSPGVKRALALAPLLKLLGGRGMIRGRIRQGLTDASANPAWITDEVLDGYAEGPAADVGATLRTLRDMADAEEPQALAPRLDRISCPVLMLLGGAPHRSAPSMSELQLLGARIPGYRQLLIPGSGHYLHEERADAVLRALVES